MVDKQSKEEPVHSDEYKRSHPHIHEVKYKDKSGHNKIYTYRYGEIHARKKKSALQKARED
jgi:hypothetical protein